MIAVIGALSLVAIVVCAFKDIAAYRLDNPRRPDQLTYLQRAARLTAAGLRCPSRGHCDPYVPCAQCRTRRPK